MRPLLSNNLVHRTHQMLLDSSCSLWTCFSPLTLLKLPETSPSVPSFTNPAWCCLTIGIKGWKPLAGDKQHIISWCLVFYLCGYPFLIWRHSIKVLMFNLLQKCKWNNRPDYYNSCTSWVPLGSVVQGLSAFMKQKYPPNRQSCGFNELSRAGTHSNYLT